MKKRLFVFGDMHAHKSEMSYLSKSRFKEYKSLTKNDIVFFLGDFGGFFYYKEYENGFKDDKKILDNIISQKYTSVVILGNHDNYDIVEDLPIIEIFGGRMHEYSNGLGSIYIAIRGEIYTFNEKKFFTFGGAKSNPENLVSLNNVINGDRLTKIKYRYGEVVGRSSYIPKISGVNYWEKELPTDTEIEYALNNLERHSYKVDYVLSHTCPLSVIRKINKIRPDSVSEFFESILGKLKFSEWHYGHFHSNISIDNFHCHYMASPVEINLN